jgi:hypothetical protein
MEIKKLQQTSIIVDYMLELHIKYLMNLFTCLKFSN